MQPAETTNRIRADRSEYQLLHAHDAPAPREVLHDERREDDPIIGADYDSGVVDLLRGAAQRAKEQAMHTLYPNAEELSSDDPQVRRAATEVNRKAVFNDDGTRARLMKNLIVSSAILEYLDQLPS